MGSENGTPSSIKSAPRASSSRTSRRVVARSGSPATINGTSAASLPPSNSRNLRSILPPRRILHTLPQRHAQRARDRVHVLVTSPRKVYDDDPFFGQGWSELG